MSMKRNKGIIIIGLLLAVSVFFVGAVAAQTEDRRDLVNREVVRRLLGDVISSSRHRASPTHACEVVDL